MKADDSVRRSLQLENECADTLAHKGYQVHQNPTRPEIAEARHNTGDTGSPDKDPDYLIEGHVFDCYSPKPTKPPRGVWSEVRDKIDSRQTQRVVLNLENWRGDLGALQKQFDDWPIPNLKELSALTRGGATLEFVRRD
ncbi:hypothetical protein AB0M79_25275 [Polymorphospora sp. NPDC051019]|uniref:CdiA C-terminal domain-containing protein n=1 Tax=Polymorphospora sp. NPDC051019 TaxID=3155725 RepID=UPI003413C06F